VGSKTGFAIFLLFFGVSLLEAVRQGDLLASALWLVFGLMFLWADSRAAPARRHL